MKSPGALLWWGWIALAAVSEMSAVTPEGSIHEMLGGPRGTYFRIERTGGVYHLGDTESHYGSEPNVGRASFDIGNGKALGDVAVDGTLRSVTVYRASYPIDAGISGHGGWSGVWMAKDHSTSGAYSYTVVLNGERSELAKVNWDFQTGLLDDIFPLTEFRDPHGLASIKLISFAPVSRDGIRRCRGVIYGLELTNLSAGRLRGRIIRPAKRFAARKEVAWADYAPPDLELSDGDDPGFAPEVDFDLARGESVWVPTLIFAPGDPAPSDMAALGCLESLQASGQYYRGLLGRLRIPGHPFLAEFYEREALEALQSLALAPDGQFAGSNWGSAPPTHLIWMKDCYYSALPCVAMEPNLAREAILWFDRHGVRPPDPTGQGGINHSLGLSVAAPLLGAIYYDHSADRGFFLEHRELKESWTKLLDAVIASRRDPAIWLFPTHFVSDGAVTVDFHTGSNIDVWRALGGFARILREVYGEPGAAREYEADANRVKEALERQTVVNGPDGAQFIDGTYSDGRPPPMVSDGEESDVTLMPFYGLVRYDDPRYLRDMRFAFTSHNADFNPLLRSLTWRKKVPSTSPGYMKGLCAGLSDAEEFGLRGAYTELRHLADVDGSLWWWSYGEEKRPVYGQPVRAFDGQGKSGWTAGVHTVLFAGRFAGIGYDAPRRTVRFSPLAVIGDFDWSDFPAGNARFGAHVHYATDSVEMRFENPNPFPVELDAELQVSESATGIRVDGRSVEFERERYLGENAVRFKVAVPAAGACVAEVR